ncbi:MAG: efflux RND transporter periplasmic adaptor subunit [Verrucomicrobiota bacterium]
MKRIVLALVAVLVIAGFLGGTYALQVKKMIAGMEAMGTPAETVSSADVRQDQWQGTLNAVGTIAAVQGVNVTTEIAGTVKEIAFESGALVDKGALLVRLDTSSEEAQLRALEAQAELSRINATRVRALRAENTVSQAELDTSEATLKQNEANADAIRAVIEKKTIRAPFAGQLGIRQVNLGQYLDVGKPIVSLQSLAPVYAQFSLPQQDVPRLTNGMVVRLASDAFGGHTFEGLLTAINPDLDADTRSVRLQATFENADRLLRPGMFARVEVLLPERQDVVVIPATAVLSSPYGDSVYVISEEKGKDGKAGLVVTQKFIRLGRYRGDFVSVESGLKPGERIASAGVFKLRNGMSVIVNNDIAPKATETPRPADS